MYDSAPRRNRGNKNGRRNTMGEEKKRLSDIENLYQNEIEPYDFVQLVAGVGSGKTTYVENFIKGNPEKNIPRKTVLLITSRKSKVLESLNEDDLPVEGKIRKWDSYHCFLSEENELNDENIKYLRILKDGWGEHRVMQKSVVCTNAFIEAYLKYFYKPQDITTHIWELFDMIVVDEVHSMIVDASYQSAPFYVRSLINKTLTVLRTAKKEGRKLPACQHVILMTGTPEPVEGIKADVVIDKREECPNVAPKNVYFIDRDEAKKRIKAQYEKNEKIIHFTNHTFFPKDYAKNMDINKDGVVVSFSKDERRTELKKSDAKSFKEMEETEKAIREKMLLPDYVKIFATTSRNKEGININNENIPHMYIEAHNRTDAVQMAGRLRVGVKNLYVIVDEKPVREPGWKYEAEFTELTQARSNPTKGDKGALNDYLVRVCKDNGIEKFGNNDNCELTAYDKKCEEISKFIEFAHEKFPYARFNYVTNRFEYYAWRKLGIEYSQEQESCFKNAYLNGELTSLGKEWFPTANIYNYVSREKRAKAILDEFIAKSDSGKFLQDELDSLCNTLNSVFGTDYKKINRVLEKFTNKHFERCSQNNKRPNYDKFQLVYGNDTEV